MEQQPTNVTKVHSSRVQDWFWAIVHPIVLYLLMGKLLQSFGLFLPPFSEPQYPIGWGVRLFVCIGLIVWLRTTAIVFSRVRNVRPVLLVSDHGIEFPGVWNLRWDEIDRITNQFGTLKFHPKNPLLKHAAFNPSHASFKQWRDAKSRIKRCAPISIAESI